MTTPTIQPSTAAAAAREALESGDPFAVIRRYRRATNFLAAAQVYLKSNALLREPLTSDDVKPRLLGHWGAAPAINLVYAHLDRLVNERGTEVLLVTGPGHGAAANLANHFLDGSLAEFYPDMTRDAAGVERFVRAFSWPGGFPSHLTPGTPGTIHEGGELGYALATAFGAAMDNPDLLVACIVGDGEAETGPTAGSWNGNRFLDPRTGGAVLPILDVNGYKISSATITGTMSDDELVTLFSGYGWEPIVVSGADDAVDVRMAEALDEDGPDRRDPVAGHAPASPVHEAALADDRAAHAEGLDRAEGSRRQEGRRLVPVPPGARRRPQDEPGPPRDRRGVAALVQARGAVRARRDAGRGHPRTSCPRATCDSA